MPPVQMTKQEYEAKYGVKPAIATSTLDTTPAPLRMSLNEYNKIYGPKKTSFVQDAKQDFLEMGQGVDRALVSGQQAIQDTTDRVVSGETTPKMGTFQTLGGGLATGSKVAITSALGFAKMALPEETEKKVGKFFADWGGAISARAKQRLAEMRTGTQEEKNVAGLVDEISSTYQSNPDFKATVDAAGGFADWFLAPTVASKVAPPVMSTAIKTADVITDAASGASKVLPNNIPFTEPARVDKVVKALETIETKYSDTRRAMDVDPKAPESRMRIAQSGVLRDAVDENGVIRTKQQGGAIDKYRQTPITENGLTLNDVEDVVRRLLDNEGTKINLKEVGDYLKTEIATGNKFEGADLVAALKGIERELQGLAVRADIRGDVPLSVLQDAKISNTQYIDYTKPGQKALRETKARIYRTIIEDKSKSPVKKINQELAQYYKDIARLEKLDGKRVEGGRLGKLTAGVTGSAIGAVAGGAGGSLGALLGGVAGGEVASLLKGRQMAGALRSGTGNLPQSPLLQKADSVARANITDLKTPSKTVGIPADTIAKATPEQRKEVVKLEGQIKQNIKKQQSAIKAGQFDLVQELKGVYDILVMKLDKLVKDIIESAKNPTAGMTIRAQITEKQKRRIAEALEDYDTTPMTVNNKLDLSDSDTEFRIGQLQDRNNNGIFTDADAIEAEKLLTKKGIKIELD